VGAERGGQGFGRHFAEAVLFCVRWGEGGRDFGGDLRRSGGCGTYRVCILRFVRKEYVRERVEGEKEREVK
jgi:hypothetical protein